MTACTNCGTTEWAAKNDEYCTSCHDSYMKIFIRLFRQESEGTNPKQYFADKIMREYGTMP